MKRNIKYIIIFLIISSSSLIKGIAQESYLLKELRIPQVAQENPGAVIPYDAHICFPMLGKIHVGVNSFVNLGDIVSISDGLLDKLKKNNTLHFWGQIDPIHFGFRINKKNYFSITTAIKMNANVTLKKDFFSFLIKGNAPFEGKELSFLGNDFLSVNSYAEIGLGYNREINENISFGINAKYLLGLFNAHTSKAELLLYTGDKYHELEIKHTLQGKMAGIVDIDSIVLEDIVKNFKNHGFSFDLGARYRINKLFEVSASVLDIGLIKWKTNAKQYSVENKPFSVVGMEYDDIVADTGLLITNFDPNGYLREIADSIGNSLFSDLEKTSSYIKWLNLRFNVGGSIYASSNDRFNFTFTGQFINGVFIPSGCVSYHRTCGKWFDFVIGNTFKTNAIFNPGLGMNLTLEVFQLYLAVDYTNTIVYIDKAKNVNVALGVNFVAPLSKAKVFRASYPY
ncbi:MAG: DUF5723 family protein [Bacteroidales bacterium]|jgi:hypothetical protein|nr:DUF5723 family protein [Bacteroidales bacterium]